MTFDTTGSEITFSTLQGDGVSDDDGDGVIVLSDISGNVDYVFWIEAAPGTYGTYTVVTDCVSDAPSTSPSRDPTVDPTADPTVDPTSEPTIDPTADPTNDPTV